MIDGRPQVAPLASTSPRTTTTHHERTRAERWRLFLIPLPHHGFRLVRAIGPKSYPASLAYRRM